MQTRKTSGRTTLAVIFIGFAFSSTLIFYGSLKNWSKSNPALLTEKIAGPRKQKQASVALPVRLKISGISVDAAVEQVGLTPNGAMDTPKGPAEVAWFDLGTRPGESGSAVITGHHGTWKNGQSSVFDNLYKLRQGDKIDIVDEKGAIITFVVQESRNFDPNADATDVFASSDGKSHLNLITCEGTWNKDSKSYSQRLVVFADKE